MKKYLIVIEPTKTGFSAYSPDLPGCVSTGRTREEVELNMREAITFHLDGLREEGQAVPEPQTYSAYVELPAQLASAGSEHGRNHGSVPARRRERTASYRRVRISVLPAWSSRQPIFIRFSMRSTRLKSRGTGRKEFTLESRICQTLCG